MYRQLGPMMQQIQQPCNECEGTGEIMNPKDRCKTCNGKKVVSERKVLEVHIDKGMKSGQQIKFTGESDQAPGIIPGDVVIVVEEKPHERFQRKGDDLFCEADIDLLTALAGGEIIIPHLDDRALHVTIVPGEIIKPGATKCISGGGMPSFRHHELGDLFVRLNVIFPNSLEPSAFPLLEKALPKRPALPKIDKKYHLEEVTLEEPNDRQRRTANANGDDMDEDDDDGRPGVQCAQREYEMELEPAQQATARAVRTPRSVTNTHRVKTRHHLVPAIYPVPALVAVEIDSCVHVFSIGRDALLLYEPAQKESGGL